MSFLQRSCLGRCNCCFCSHRTFLQRSGTLIFYQIIDSIKSTIWGPYRRTATFPMVPTASCCFQSHAKFLQHAWSLQLLLVSPQNVPGRCFCCGKRHSLQRCQAMQLLLRTFLRLLLHGLRNVAATGPRPNPTHFPHILRTTHKTTTSHRSMVALFVIV